MVEELGRQCFSGYEYADAEELRGMIRQFALRSVQVSAQQRRVLEELDNLGAQLEARLGRDLEARERDLRQVIAERDEARAERDRLASELEHLDCRLVALESTKGSDQPRLSRQPSEVSPRLSPARVTTLRGTTGATAFAPPLRQLSRKNGQLEADIEDAPPVLVLHHLSAEDLDQMDNIEHIKKRLKYLLAWAVPLVAKKEVRLVEFRVHDARSIVPDLMPAGYVFEEVVDVIELSNGLSAMDSLDGWGPRALLCGGILERVLYPAHDLLRSGIANVGIVPQLCGWGHRSGEITRAHAISHLEEVLGLDVLSSVKKAIQWLVPESSAELPAPPEQCELNITVVSEDDTELTDDQKLVVSLLLPDDTASVKLVKLGKGWSSALKFLCFPQLRFSRLQAKQAATTFVKMGPESEIEEELDITHHMMELLGTFCPQVLGYAEIGETAAVHLTLADLGDQHPKGFADIYAELISTDIPVAGTDAGKTVADRLDGCIDFVFGTLLKMLYNAKDTQRPRFSIADELGLCKDLKGGLTGVEEHHNMSSGWVLEKLWKKKPGDGGLASSVKIHIKEILGAEAVEQAFFTFPELPSLRVENICKSLLDKPERLKRVKDMSMCHHLLCFVHGDLHGDNIMIDSRDNRFLIDFGKTSLGHPLEDITWLESFVMWSYTDYNSDEELASALALIRVLAPPAGFDADTCQATVMNAAFEAQAPPPMSPRMQGMWGVVRRLRSYLGQAIHEFAHSVPGSTYAEELRHAAMVASLLFMRNGLFFMAARENKSQPRRRKLALAFACGYAETIRAMCQGKAHVDLRANLGHVTAIPETIAKMGRAKRASVALQGLPIKEMKEKRMSMPASVERPLDSYGYKGVCRMRIIAVSDLFDLSNLARLKTLINVESASFARSNVVTCVAGNFLGPSMLSSLDAGTGAVRALNKLGIQLVCFGNHDAHLPMSKLACRMSEFNGTWLNSNMPDFKPKLKENYVVSLDGDDGRPGARKVGFLGLCVSNTSRGTLYKSDAFAGAAKTMMPTSEAAGKASFDLRATHPDLDEVIPLTHQSLQDDVALAKTELFSLILGGHDAPEPVHQVFGSSAVVKSGVNAGNAAIIDIVWNSDSVHCPAAVNVQIKKVIAYQPNHEMVEELASIHRPVTELKNATLYEAKPGEKLSSVGARLGVSTLARLAASAVRDTLTCDAALLPATVFNGEKQYGDVVTFADLQEEFPNPTAVIVARMPFSVLRDAIRASREPWKQQRESSWALHVDDGIQVTEHHVPMTVGGQDPPKGDLKLFNIACECRCLQKNEVLAAYAAQHPEHIQLETAGRPLLPTLVEYFCGYIWRRIAESVGGANQVEKADRIVKKLDVDKNGLLDTSELLVGMKSLIGERLASNVVAEQMIAMIDVDNDGHVSVEELRNGLNKIMFNKVANLSIQTDFFALATRKSGCRMRIIAVNDVYELTNLPQLKTFIDKESQGLPPENVITTLAGDFLGPSVLSSLDSGFGMVRVMNMLPIKMVCFGNHETDVPYAKLQQRVKEFNGVWLNSNMPDFKPLLPTHTIVKLVGEDGQTARKIAFVGFCIGGGKFGATYREDAFGGAAQTMIPILEAAPRLVAELRAKYPDLDEVIPMTHQDMLEDTLLAESGLFPLIIGAHDHDPTHEVIGARKCPVVKAGMDAKDAAIFDVTWPMDPKGKPEVSVVIKSLATYEPDPKVLAEVNRIHKPVKELESAIIYEMSSGEALSSIGIKFGESTMAVKVATAIRDCLKVDACFVNSGAVRGKKTYDSTISYGDLKLECPYPSTMVVTKMPFDVLRNAVRKSREPWWREPRLEGNSAFHGDVGMRIDENHYPVTIMGGAPIISADKLYEVACDTRYLKKNPVLADYASKHPERIQPEDCGRPVLPILVEYFCGQIWQRVIASTGTDAAMALKTFDTDNDGHLSHKELAAAIESRLGAKLSSRIIVEQMVALLDVDGDGMISVEELNEGLKKIM